MMGLEKELVCPNCGHQGRSKTVTKGSFGIELILWLLFIVPGVIYSVWRLTTRHQACRECGANNMVPVGTPRGKKLVEEFKP